MSDEWNDIGFVISSNYRVTVLRRLDEGPATPSQIAGEWDVAITHVSRALNELRDRDLVERHVSAITDRSGTPIPDYLLIGPPCLNQKVLP